MSTQELNQIERNIQKAKEDVAFGQCLERLRVNKDFKKVVLEGFFEKEAIRLVHLKSDPSMQISESQANIIKQMDSIGVFSEYLNTGLYRARMALKSIESDEAMRDEILAEEGAE